MNERLDWRTILNHGLLNQREGYNVSDRYSVITTQDLVNRLEGEGYEVTQVQASIPRKKSKEGFQRHLIRVTRSDMQRTFQLNEVRPEIVIVNSYDKTSALKIMLGMYRLVCLNGLVAGKDIGAYSVRHVGNIWDKTRQALDNTIKVFPTLSDKVNKMQQVHLSDRDAYKFAHATGQRLLDGKEYVTFDPHTILNTRRYQDHGKDLFTVFNVIQENAIRGGLSYAKFVRDKESGAAQLVHKRLRKIQAIDKQVKINQFIWDKAAELAG